MYVLSYFINISNVKFRCGKYEVPINHILDCNKGINALFHYRITEISIVDKYNMKRYKKKRIFLIIIHACFTAVMGPASER